MFLVLSRKKKRNEKFQWAPDEKYFWICAVNSH